MSDWQVGDLAECICDSEAFRAFGLFKGGIYRVVGLAYARPGFRDAGKLGLALEGITVSTPTNAVIATRFKKVHPPQNEACEPEFVTLLKRSKRKVTAIAAAARQSGDVKQAPGEAPQSGHEVASPKGGSHA